MSCFQFSLSFFPPYLLLSVTCREILHCGTPQLTFLQAQHWYAYCFSKQGTQKYPESFGMKDLVPIGCWHRWHRKQVSCQLFPLYSILRAPGLGDRGRLCNMVFKMNAATSKYIKILSASSFFNKHHANVTFPTCQSCLSWNCDKKHADVPLFALLSLAQCLTYCIHCWVVWQVWLLLFVSFY